MSWFNRLPASVSNPSAAVNGAQNLLVPDPDSPNRSISESLDRNNEGGVEMAPPVNYDASHADDEAENAKRSMLSKIKSGLKTTSNFTSNKSRSS